MKIAILLVFSISLIFYGNSQICDSPSALFASNITVSSADLGWTENGAATSWNIEYGISGYTQGLGFTQNGVITNPYILTGITANVSYDFYVQSICSANQSTWIGPFTFITPPVCNSPSSLSVSNISAVSADLSWIENGTATTWNIEYGTAGFGQGSGSTNSVSTTPYNLLALSPNTTYDLYVQSECGINQSTWVGPIQFTTGDCLLTGQGGTKNTCELEDTLNLNNNIITLPSYPGIWQYPTDPSRIVNNQKFVITGLPTGIYEVDYVVSGVCPETVTATIIVHESSFAGYDDSITVCKNQRVDMDSLIFPGAITTGVWYDPSNTPLPDLSHSFPNIAGLYIYSYIAHSSGCPADTVLLYVTIDHWCDYLSVSDVELFDISVYPTPATNVLTILNSSNTSFLKVEMYDMNGRIVMVENKALINASKAVLAIEHLERGVYTLRVYNSKVQKIFKIVKQ